MILSVLRSNRSSAAASTLSTSGAMGLSEKTFLNPKKMTATKEVRDEKGPSLDDFDKEIEIYQVCKVVVISSSLTSDETVRRICQKKSLFFCPSYGRKHCLYLPLKWSSQCNIQLPFTLWINKYWILQNKFEKEKSEKPWKLWSWRLSRPGHHL